MENQKCTPPDHPHFTPAGGPPLPVLHDDSLCLAVDKPPGWTCPASLGIPHANAAAADSPPSGSTVLRVLEPLEPEASGLLVLAKSTHAFTTLSRRLAHPDVRRGFLAVVGGKPPHRSWTCCLKISPDPTRPGRVATHTTRGQSAHTRFEVLAHGDGLALILASPGLPRPHQIRAHLAAAAIPIVGDHLYGFGRDLPKRGRRHRLLEHTAPDRRPPTPHSRLHLPELALRAITLDLPGSPDFPALELSAPFDDFLARFGFASEAPETDSPDSPTP